MPRETELAELEQQYQKIIGAQTVTFRGQEYTPAQMAPFLEETDRALRQEVWELIVQRRLQDRDTLDELFDRMVQLRVAIGREAGLASYTDYAYKNRERFDYDPAAVGRFRDAIETVVVPLARDLQEQRKQVLAVDTLRPWDVSVDPLGRPPLRPFQDADAFARGTKRSSTPLIRNLGPSSSSSADGACSTWPIARERRPAGIKRHSKTIAFRSSS